MLIDRRVVLVLKAFLVVLFGVLLMLQTFSFPGQFAYMAREHPDQAHLRWPLTALAAFMLLCVEVVVVSIWKLLSLTRSDRIFSEAAFTWVNAILAAIGAAWVALVGIFLWVGFNADDPGVPLLLFLMVVAVAVVGLLILVMRALLRQATSLRTDLEAVI